MALIVEDGTGIQTADSYVAAADVVTYATAHGAVFVLTDPVAADASIRRATQFIDSYRARFPGYRSHRRLQALEWPRIIAFTRVPSGGRDFPSFSGADRNDSYADYLGISYIANNEIPVEIVQATCEASIRELAAPFSMQPDLDRGGKIERLKAGSVEIQYGANADAMTTFMTINGLLSGLLMPSSGGLVGTVARG